MNVTTSEAQKNVTLYQGYATANATTITGAANSYYQSVVLNAQGTAYASAQSTLGISSKDNMLDYIYFTNMVSTNQSVLVGIDSVFVK